VLQRGLAISRHCFAYYYSYLAIIWKKKKVVKSFFQPSLFFFWCLSLCANETEPKILFFLPRYTSLCPNFQQLPPYKKTFDDVDVLSKPA